MAAHEPQWSSPSAGLTLLTRRAIDLLVSWVVAETLTAPCRYVFLLLQCLLHCVTSLQHLDLQPLEETLVGPVRVAPAPVALLWPPPLRAAPPFVVGAIALPTETRVWGVVELWHLERSPRLKSEGGVRRRTRRPCDHAGISVGKGLIQTRPLHPILDGPNRLLYVKSCAAESGLLLMEVVELLFYLDLQLELLSETRHLRINARIFQVSERLVNGIGAQVLSQELK